MKKYTNLENSGYYKLIDLQKITRLISNSDDLHSACLLVDDYLSHCGFKLKSVAFGHLGSKHPTNRAFRDYPPVLVNISEELRETTGCPVFRKASQIRYAFDALLMDKKDQPNFLSKRYLDELAKLGYQSVAVIPVGIGRGLAVFSIGLPDSVFAGELGEFLTKTICEISIAIISRFPEITKLFETRCLSTFEAETILLCSSGFSNSEIASITNLSERTINMIFDNAASKLGAKNQSHAVSKSIALGEISNLQLGLEETA